MVNTMTHGPLAALVRESDAFADETTAKSGTMQGMPSKGTPIRAVRISDGLWLPFLEVCDRKDEKPADVVRELVRGYTTLHGDEIWTRALAVATERGDDLDAVVRNLLDTYIDDSPDSADK